MPKTQPLLIVASFSVSCFSTVISTFCRSSSKVTDSLITGVFLIRHIQRELPAELHLIQNPVGAFASFTRDNHQGADFYNCQSGIICRYVVTSVSPAILQESGCHISHLLPDTKSGVNTFFLPAAYTSKSASFQVTAFLVSNWKIIFLLQPASISTFL